MVWATLFPGIILGLGSAFLGYVAAGLSLWLSLLLYPTVGVATVFLLMSLLLLRCRIWPDKAGFSL